MHIINYLIRFPNDKECVKYFREIREVKGIICDSCGSEVHLWDDLHHKYSCLHCGNKIHLYEGTVMEDSPLPLKYWFLCIYLLTYPERPYSLEDVRSKLDYIGKSEVDDMLTKLESVILSTGNNKNFDILLYTCAGGLQEV
jgi:hypothetical protein